MFVQVLDKPLRSFLVGRFNGISVQRDVA